MAVVAGQEEHLLAGGRWVDAAGGDRFDVTNPATGEVVGSVPDAGEADVRAAIDAASAAFEPWKGLAADEIGPLIDEKALDKVAEHVEDAVDHGARLLAGGERLSDDELRRGAFFAPTVLADVTTDMLISREETFGPVAGVVPFDSEDEAVALANDTVFGLAAYFHTRDYARLLRVAERLEYGIVGANSGLISAANVPFGGVKESGYGREGGDVGIDEYVDVKYVLLGGVS